MPALRTNWNIAILLPTQICEPRHVRLGLSICKGIQVSDCQVEAASYMLAHCSGATFGSCQANQSFRARAA